MKTSLIAAFATWLGVSLLSAQTTNDYAALKTSAEKLFTDGSYARAHSIYEEARALELSTADLRWVEFRLADTQWRSMAATQTADNTRLEEARRQLEAMVRDIMRVEDHDRVWAE